MQFRLLGPVEIDSSGQIIRLPRRRERCLLAVLLLNPHRVVSIDRLAELLWDGEPPDRARRIIHSHISRLRATLANGNGTAIESIGDGYRITVDPQTVDVHRFQTLLDQAATAADPANRANQLRAALDLWRGPPLDNEASDWLRARICTRIEEQHRTATEDWLTTSLELGRTRDVLPELAQLASADPGRESLVALHMRALYHAGRKADALEIYNRARNYLAEQLGLDPSPSLRDLHQAVLRDRGVAPHPPAAAELLVSAQSTVPRQLPADVPSFTGRGEQLQQLDARLEAGEAGTVVISAIGGTAGVGKSALAVHWAHRVAPRFPDGQLYVNLRGYDPDQPMNPADALARLLTALGVPSQDLPLELDDRAARYRSELADRRMLIVLDNTATVEQVRPLLPGTGACAVVVTSRDRLAGLVAIHGAHRLDLDLLPPADAIALLRRLIGPRVDSEPEAAAALADQCARLPLALRIAAELAVTRPTTPLRELVVELDDQQRRLELLDADGDPLGAVRAVFSWSVRQLPSEVARAFRLLGLHPGPDFDRYAAAALASVSLDEAHRTLDQLARAHLIHPTVSGRYAMHDLLHAYAKHLCTTEDANGLRQAALTRLFDYYLETAAAAMDRWYPAETHRRPPVRRTVNPSPELVDSDLAIAWLDAEHPTLVTAVAHTAAHGWSAHATRLSMILYRYLDHRHADDALTVHRYAHEAAERAGDPAAQANAMRCIGIAHIRGSQYGLAADYLHRALDALRKVGDEINEASVLASLGNVEERLGRYQSSTSKYRQALAIYRRAGDRVGEALTMTSLGIVEERTGHYDQAIDHHEQALASFQKLGHNYGEAHALSNLGVIELLLSRYHSSEEYHARALALFRKIGDTAGEAHTLDSLGIVQTRLGRLNHAIQYFEDSLTLFREINHREGQAWAFNGLGEAARLSGRPSDAVAHHHDALTITASTGTRDQQARAHAGLGNAYSDLGDVARAGSHYEHALAIYSDLGMPEADDVRSRLRG